MNCEKHDLGGKDTFSSDMAVCDDIHTFYICISNLLQQQHLLLKLRGVQKIQTLSHFPRVISIVFCFIAAGARLCK
jgi:hypothetical protein